MEICRRNARFSSEESQKDLKGKPVQFEVTLGKVRTAASAAFLVPSGFFGAFLCMKFNDSMALVREDASIPPCGMLQTQVFPYFLQKLQNHTPYVNLCEMK